MPPSHPGPITDSPLFWLLLFGSVGLVMLTAVEPKFIKRQERIERMRQSRQLAGQATARASRKQAAERPTTPRWQPGKRANLQPLMLFLAGVLVAAMIGMQVGRLRATAAHRRASAAETERGKDA